MKNLLPALLILLLACSNPKVETPQPHAELADLFEAIDNSGASPEDSLWRGHHPKGAWRLETIAFKQARVDSLRYFLDALEAIDDADLSEQEKISKAVMRMNLTDQIDHVRFKMYFIPFNAEGGFYNDLSYAVSSLPFTTAANYNDYLAWLPRYEQVLRENVALMKQGMAEGIVAPKIIVTNTLSLLQPWVTADWKQSPFYAPIAQLPESIDEVDKQAIAEQSEKVIGSLTRTYQNVHAFFANEYLAAAKEAPGIGFLPGGKAYYENRVRHYTTLPLSPDSIHNLGLAEVARIKAAMEAIIAEVKWKGSFADFIQFLRTDPQFYAKTPQELLNYASWLSKKAEGKLPSLFNNLYSLPFTVEPVPANIAPTYTAGRFVGGSWETKRAGIYWVNTYNLPSRTLYTLPALTLHEAVPGHHLQISLAAEIKDLPGFRNRYYISAFGEGWGLYSEYLGEEMGMYTTPYERFGRYTYEMWRACRLVVDTGIHCKGWTREQALDYLAAHTALSMHEVTTEIDRYIGWPGQALSYKVGEIKIKQLHTKAEAALGDQFNIGEFHHAILKNGSVPLTQLEAQVDAYIDDKVKVE